MFAAVVLVVAAATAFTSKPTSVTECTAAQLAPNGQCTGSTADCCYVTSGSDQIMHFTKP